jgi:hypothetical protein
MVCSSNPTISLDLRSTDIRDRISLSISYPLEILSFKIRANGLLMQNIATYVCLAISQYVIPLGIAAGSWKFYFFFEGWLVIQLVTVFFCFPETKGATLEEINQTVDGSEAVEEIKVKAHEIEDNQELRQRHGYAKDNGIEENAVQIENINEKMA